MTERDRDIERTQRLVRERFGEGLSPSDELIRERREEASREAREYENQGPLDVGAVRRRLGLLRSDDEGRGYGVEWYAEIRVRFADKMPVQTEWYTQRMERFEESLSAFLGGPSSRR